MLRKVEPKSQAGGRYPSPAPPVHHPHAHIYTFSLCGEGWGGDPSCPGCQGAKGLQVSPWQGPHPPTDSRDGEGAEAQC